MAHLFTYQLVELAKGHQQSCPVHPDMPWIHPGEATMIRLAALWSYVTDAWIYLLRGFEDRR